ncbi:bifunctional UDP-N-acetylglucosamine diphosphorylase/glucosamine-1-phosphate N-acetyltransferase GlmU [Planomicrobium sp. CPCC 101110]|uniref:bifunctional UDP-N-acetylglucosamine diphosphorylase/glucosamine-1-phosphate N-acetyltransferase GlmU n=1 Tax=Planomicrobium sp. CPCC 101110 TaxID=2599619 RepID=UPI0011B4996D|nr:bifunctional UDP-N-acetylglucosamine diphosphorylase/glucosamine-1-phosphate N-acetyltransferase GlmU [Planomicrobium sp. CPCC 101110]TWT28617.1 bifunctional UDP-N-acetylglucosamine diphosphorylase/glucosamine-1-phosphate N-acetyltransferase GlmU [Planomicrobium sp. CPCC 101110]
MNTYAVILAAGQGTRMKSKLYKVLHPVCGMPMVEHVTENVSQLGVEKIVTIVGHGAEKVQEQLGAKSEYALQAEQLGTAHAVQQAASLIEGKPGTTLVVCGDTPLIRPETMQALLDHHNAERAKATILTAIADNPTGYGRILRSEAGSVERIVEQKDASPEEQLVTEINTGTYCFDNESLFEALKLVSNDNVQGEYYLPDVIEILQKQGETVAAFATDSFEETLGVNDRVALSEAERIMRARIAEKHMRAGVSIIDPASTYISMQAEIGRDTVLQPNVMIEGSAKIGEDCFISSGTTISNSVIGDRTSIRSSHVYDSVVGEDAAVGPFAHLRPESSLGNDVKIGNFVEVKKASLGNNSKVSHLSYIGDAEVGTNVNIGCGTITVNYDGKNKYMTTIEDDSFIGCNSNLIAPVTIGKGSYVAAGSTISKNVPSDALAIARARQENKEGYVAKLNGKK